MLWQAVASNRVANLYAPLNSAIDRIQSRGEMLVGYLVWEPCVLRDQRTGELSGIFPDMVAQIAKNLNVKVVWKETTLANFAAGLNTAQFDFSVGPTFVTVPRAASVKFTQPVAYVGNSAVVRKDSILKPQRLEDLNKASIKVATLQGQALEEFCHRNLPQAQIIVLSGGDLTAPLIAVSSGQADIGFMNSVTVAKYVAEHPEVEAIFTGEHAGRSSPARLGDHGKRLPDVRFLECFDHLPKVHWQAGGISKEAAHRPALRHAATPSG